MPFKTELEFQTYILKALKKRWWFVRNIPDIGNTKKPFDASGNWDWWWVAFEFKLSKNKTEPSDEHFYKKLYPHQIASLLEFEAPMSKGKSFVICAWNEWVYVYQLNNDWWSLILKDKIKWDVNIVIDVLEVYVSQR